MKTINKKRFLRISKCSSRFQSHKDLGTGMYLKQDLEEVVIVYQDTNSETQNRQADFFALDSLPMKMT